MLIFSNYSKSFENIHISQPVVDINLEDTNKLIVRYPKFKRITHLILSFDAENLFLNSKSAYGYSFNFEEVLGNIENQTQNGYFVVGVTSNKSRKKQYNPYPRTQNINHAVEHLNSLINIYVPSILSDYDVDVNSVKKIVMGASMGGLMSLKTSILFPYFDNVFSFSPAFWFGFPDFISDLNNLNKNLFCNLSVGTNEGGIFGDSVSNIFPSEWNLDFSNNNSFYLSGVREVNKAIQAQNIKTNFLEISGGEHNEHTWVKVLEKFLNSV